MTILDKRGPVLAEMPPVRRTTHLLDGSARLGLVMALAALGLALAPLLFNP